VWRRTDLLLSERGRNECTGGGDAKQASPSHVI
jgi:hypothetical protein